MQATMMVFIDANGVPDGSIWFDTMEGWNAIDHTNWKTVNIEVSPELHSEIVNANGAFKVVYEGWAPCTMARAGGRLFTAVRKHYTEVSHILELYVPRVKRGDFSEVTMARLPVHECSSTRTCYSCY